MGPKMALSEDDHTFERDKLSFEQNFETFRDLNRIMWQVPVLAITITGGFWYAAIAVPEAQGMQRALFAMCGVLDIALIFVLMRLRFIMGGYLKMIRTFNEARFVDARSRNPFLSNYVVVIAFSLALGVAGGVSLAKMFCPDFLNG